MSPLRLMSVSFSSRWRLASICLRSARRSQSIRSMQRVTRLSTFPLTVALHRILVQICHLTFVSILQIANANEPVRSAISCSQIHPRWVCGWLAGVT